MRARVVVTGMGIVSPIGIGVSEFWKAALAGQSGISAITSFDPFPMDGYRSKVAGQVLDFAIERFLDSTHGERVDRYAQFALVATKEALADSGLQMSKENPHRVGVIVGAGMGGMVMGEREITQLYQQQKPHRVHPNFIPVITLNSASGIIAMAYGAKGPNLTISTACSSSAHALGQALHCIREGRADVVIVVGADASITPLVFAGFCSSARPLLQIQRSSREGLPALRSLARRFHHGRRRRNPYPGISRACQETQGEGVCRNCRLRRHQRGLSYGDSPGRWIGSGPYHEAGPRRRRGDTGTSGLHQCARHIDDYRRRR